VRVPLSMAIAAGQHSVEHPRIFLFECYRGAAEFRALPDPVAAYTTDMRARFIDEHDPVRCAELMAAMAASETWWTPTLQVLRMSALAGNRQFREDPRRRYIPFILWAGLWQPDADRAVAHARHASGRDVDAELYRLAMDNVRQAHDAGVRIVAGTDAGDTYVFPGLPSTKSLPSSCAPVWPRWTHCEVQPSTQRGSAAKLENTAPSRRQGCRYDPVRCQSAHRYP